MSAMPWFRVYSEARTDRKLDTLTDDEHRVWFNLLCYASESDTRGSIVMDEELVAIECARGDVELLNRAVDKLVRLRILDRSDGGVTFIAFDERQSSKPSDRAEATRERKRRQRAREQGESECHAPVTPLSRGVTHREEKKEREITPPLTPPRGAGGECRSFLEHVEAKTGTASLAWPMKTRDAARSIVDAYGLEEAVARFDAEQRNDRDASVSLLLSRAGAASKPKPKRQHDPGVEDAVRAAIEADEAACRKEALT